MADEKKGIWYLLGELGESALGAAAYSAIEKIIRGGGEQVATHVVKKVGDLFGAGDSTETSEKVFEDNAFMHRVIRTIPEGKEKFGEFVKKLLLEENGKKKLAAVTLAVYKYVLIDKEEISKSSGGGGEKKKDENGNPIKSNNAPKESTKKVDYSAGIEKAAGFVDDLLNCPTFQDQLFFLDQTYDVFSLIKNEKKKIDLIVLAMDGFNATREKVKPFIEEAKKGVRKVNVNTTGIDNLNSLLDAKLAAMRAKRK